MIPTPVQNDCSKPGLVQDRSSLFFSMPPEKKKRNVQCLADDSEEATVPKIIKKGESGARSEASSEAKDAIKFDEYMEDGIPDSLLKGLGFSETGLPCVDESSEPEIEAESSEEEERGVAIAESEEEESLDEEYKPSRKGTIKRKAMLGRAAANSKWSNHSKQLSPSHRAGTSSKAIIRGNIMYERSETGEVVASLVKNGAEGMKSNASGGSGIGSKYMKNAQVLNELPSNCPIDENNVEDILDRSIDETNAMRMMLANLKDDLRRMGGGPNMTPQLKPVHVRKRIEIADKLLKVYCDYQTNINIISEMGHNPLSHVFPGNWTPTEQQTQPSQRGARRGRGRGTAGGRESPARKVGSSTVVESSVPPVVKTEPGATAGAVSNDLWMSCEPGSDDERMTRPGVQKQKKLARDKAAFMSQNN